MNFVSFLHFQDIWPRLHSADLGEFLSAAAQSARPNEKSRLTCWSPVDYKLGTRRSKANVERVNALVLDYDAIPGPALEQVTNALRESSLEFFTHRTYSHDAKLKTTGNHSVRVIVPLATPIASENWTSTFKDFSKLLPYPPDMACSDPGRIFALPCLDSQGAPETIQHYLGNPLPLKESSTAPQGEIKQKVVVSGLITIEDISKSVKKLERSSNADRRHLGILVRAVLDGKPYANVGSRHETMLQISYWLANEFPRAAAEDLAQLFQASQGVLGEGADTLDAIKTAIEGARVKYDELKKEQTKARDDEHRVRIVNARRDGQDFPYTSEEISTLASKQRCTVEELRNRWILYHGNATWFLTLRGYVGPCSQRDTLPAAAEHLAPAPIQIRELVGQGIEARWQLRSLTEVLASYGTQVTNTCSDLTISESYFNQETSTFHEASAPRSTITAQRHDDVELWMRCLGGNQREKLLDWIACVTRLEYQCCALYLCGPQGVGKTLLANGLAALWQEGNPTLAATALGRHNAQAAKCPIILADEELPKDKATSGALRAMLGNTHFTIEQKYKPISMVRGSTRIIFAANNPWMISLQENNSRHDLEALARRILFVDPWPDAGYLLANMPQKERDEWRHRKIAEHALYLMETRNVTHGGRFIVEGSLGHSLMQLVVSNRNTALVCEWITGYLMRPQPVETGHSNEVKRGEGKLLLTTRVVRDMWDQYVDKDNKLETREVNAALTALAQGSVTSNTQTYWDIDLGAISAWATSVGFSTKEQILKSVG